MVVRMIMTSFLEGDKICHRVCDRVVNKESIVRFDRVVNTGCEHSILRGQATLWNEGLPFQAAMSLSSVRGAVSLRRQHLCKLPGNKKASKNRWFRDSKY